MQTATRATEANPTQSSSDAPDLVLPCVPGLPGLCGALCVRQSVAAHAVHDELHEVLVEGAVRARAVPRSLRCGPRPRHEVGGLLEQDLLQRLDLPGWRRRRWSRCAARP
eukprot:1055541-Alexandrium_andersonii.AAC.1